MRKVDIPGQLVEAEEDEIWQEDVDEENIEFEVTVEQLEDDEQLMTGDDVFQEYTDEDDALPQPSNDFYENNHQPKQPQMQPNKMIQTQSEPAAAAATTTLVTGTKKAPKRKRPIPVTVAALEVASNNINNPSATTVKPVTLARSNNYTELPAIAFIDRVEANQQQQQRTETDEIVTDNVLSAKMIKLEKMEPGVAVTESTGNQQQLQQQQVQHPTKTMQTERKQSAEGERCEDTIFGELVAAMLKKMPTDNKKQAKRNIMNILLDL